MASPLSPYLVSPMDHSLYEKRSYQSLPDTYQSSVGQAPESAWGASYYPNTSESNLKPYPSQASVTEYDSQSVNSESEPARKRGHPSLGEHLAAWAPEVASLTISFCFLLAITLILVKYDGFEQPDWGSTINLNTLVAVFSTIVRSMIVLVAAEVISQAKWSWFREPRPIGHLSTFDSASRGIWGSARLFSLSKRPHIGLFAALVMVVSWAISPFAQQAIRTAICQVTIPSEIATMPAVNWVYEGGLSDAVTDDDTSSDVKMTPLQMGFKGATLGAIANPNQHCPGLLYKCLTGNCTFPEFNGITYSSVAFCSKCRDMSPMVVKGQQAKGGAPSFSLPNGAEITPYNKSWMSVVPQAGTSWQGSVAVDILMGTFAGSSTSRKPDAGLPNTEAYVDVLAASCSLYPCLRNYHGQLINSILFERTISTVPSNTSNPARDNFPALLTPCQINGNAYDAGNFSAVPRTPGRKFATVYHDGREVEAPVDCIFGMSHQLPIKMSRFLESALNGTCVQPSDTAPGKVPEIMCPDNTWWIERLWNNGNATFDFVSEVFENVSVALTVKVRETGTDASRTRLGEARGSVMQSVVCTEVQWKWLALPMLMLFISCCLLLVIIVQSWRDRHVQPLWKSSLLPFLYALGPGSERSQTYGGKGTRPQAKELGDMAKRSKEVLLQVQRDEGGWKFITGKPLRYAPQDELQLNVSQRDTLEHWPGHR